MYVLALINHYIPDKERSGNFAAQKPFQDMLSCTFISRTMSIFPDDYAVKKNI